MQIYALTNGLFEDVGKLFEYDQINQYFKDIISADEINKYKPDPSIYQHFLDKTGARVEDSWLILGNAFDIIGAIIFWHEQCEVKSQCESANGSLRRASHSYYSLYV